MIEPPALLKESRCGIPIFYRIVKGDPAVLTDFLPNAEPGKPQPPNASDEQLRSWREGVSTFDVEERARHVGRRFFPHLGNHIAQLDIAENGPIRYEKTGGKGNFDVVGDPREMLARVVYVVEL